MVIVSSCEMIDFIPATSVFGVESSFWTRLQAV